MKRLLILLGLIGVMLLGAQVPTEDPLWQQAKARAQRSWQLVPGTETTTTQILKKDGSVEMTTDIQIAHTLRNDGSIRNSYNFIKMNDEDVTESQKNKKDYQKMLNKDATPEDASLFHNRENAQARRTGNSEVIDGVQCYEFSYQYTRDDDGKEVTVKGNVWLDERGVIHRNTQTLNPLPKMVKEMSTEIFYTYDAQQDVIVPERIEIDMSISALLMKRQIKTTHSFDGYWQYQQN